MNLWEAAILGLVQGLTEFLPVSSSGHLVLGQHLLGTELREDVTFEVVVHLGTLLAVFIVFRADLAGMLHSSPRLLAPRSWRRSVVDDAGFRDIVFVGFATLPAVAVGLAFEDSIEHLFAAPRFVGAMLMVTGLVLLTTKLAKPSVRDVSFRTALIMGCAQAFAILPGISRSGSTIAAGVDSGVGRVAAGRFSFLMAIPAILGATVLELGEFAAADLNAAVLAVAFATSFVSGWLALLVLLRLVKSGRLWVFAPYLFAVGALALLFA